MVQTYFTLPVKKKLVEKYLFSLSGKKIFHNINFLYILNIIKDIIIKKH